MHTKKLIICFMLILLFHTACSNQQKENSVDTNMQEEELESIQKGSLMECSDFSIEELVNNYLNGAKWNIEKSDNVYSVSGNMYADDKTSDILIQFTKEGDSILLQNFEIDKIPQSQESYHELVMDMCQITQDKKTQEKHNQWLKDQEDKITQIQDGYITYHLAVTASSTYGNSIMPGSYIDLYDPTVQEKIISKVEVLQVLDQNGNHVFDPYTKDEVRNSSELVILIKKEDKEKLDALDGKIVLMPTQN